MLQKFNIQFCVFFDSYCHYLISGRETGHWASLPHGFDIFIIFPNFLGSKPLSRSATREGTRLSRLLC